MAATAVKDNRMRLTLFLLSASLLAQTQTTITANAILTPGQPYVVTAQLTGQAAANVTGLQFSLNYPQVWGAPTVTIAGAIATIKKVTCNGLAASVACVIIEANKTVIPNGNVAAITFNPPSTVGPGPYLLQVTGVSAVDGVGTTVAVVPGPSLTVNTVIYGDLNSDGIFNFTDIAIAVLQKLTGQATCSFDQGQGCTLNALQQWINRAASL